MRGIAFVVAVAILLPQSGTPCLAQDSNAKQGTDQQQKQKAVPEYRAVPQSSTRSFRPPAPAPLERPKGDGGKSDDTVGGLPGQKRDADEKQP
jgi:hypothetical protein